MINIEQSGTCPYLRVQLLGFEFKALLDSGSGLSLISRKVADRLMNSKLWKELEEQGRVQYNTDLEVHAVNCNSAPLKIVGRVMLPSIAIRGVDLRTTCSFWIMEGSVDEILISNQWLMPLQGALAWRGDGQVLYFKLPRLPLAAGGEAYATKCKNPSHRSPTQRAPGKLPPIQETAEQQEDNREEDQEGDGGDEDREGDEEAQEDYSAAHHHPTGIKSVRVSTPVARRSTSIYMKELGLVIGGNSQKSIVLKRKETAKVLLKFPNFGSTKEGENPLEWQQETQDS